MGVVIFIFIISLVLMSGLHSRHVSLLRAILCLFFTRIVQLPKRAGVNDVGPPRVKDVCNATDTDIFQGEESPEGDPELLLGVEWVRNNLFYHFP